MKTTKTHQVIMLPAKYKTDIFLDGADLLYRPNSNIKFKDVIYQHLYILSDEEIKKGDWIYYINKQVGDNKICQWTSKGTQGRAPFYTRKKVIATTDTSLKFREYTEEEKDKAHNNKLPNIWLYKIPQDFIKYFIKEYNKGNIITEVNVEYEEYYVNKKDNKRIHYFGFEFDDAVADGSVVPERVKSLVIKDNTISISPIKTSYTREEVEKLLKEVGMISFEHGLNVAKNKGVSRRDFTVTGWIEENL